MVVGLRRATSWSRTGTVPDSRGAVVVIATEQPDLLSQIQRFASRFSPSSLVTRRQILGSGGNSAGGHSSGGHVQC